MLLEWVKALVPVAVAVIPVIAAVIKSARATRAANAAAIKAVAEDVGAVKQNLSDHIVSDELAQMKQRRVRILRFADDVSRGRKFSDEYWTDIFEDIDEYEAYVESHKDYKNNKGKLAMEFLRLEFLKRKGVYKDGETIDKSDVVVRGWDPRVKNTGTDSNRDDRDLRGDLGSELDSGRECICACSRPEPPDVARGAS